ncbi:MAG: AbrB/MazE/SpoVT family DNA-binding domain-containing protein [Nitrospira sp.]|nr:AbrB/MazE/SpoVT family DNA-binding domain-containing protein [Nitrospira sp.]
MGMIVRVGPKYQVVIPSEIRQRIKIKPQDEVLVDIIGDVVIIIPKPASFTDFMIGLGKEVWEGIDAKDYLRKERESWA